MSRKGFIRGLFFKDVDPCNFCDNPPLIPDHHDREKPNGWDHDEILVFAMGSIMVLPGCTAYLFYGSHYNGERFA